jgi:putative phosphoesterase
LEDIFLGLNRADMKDFSDRKGLEQRMMRVGVLSDTHFSDAKKASSFLERLSERYFQDADMILHAGDLVNPDILLAFAGKTVHAVRGNMDVFSPGIPIRKVVPAGGFRIGLIHGWGSPDGLEKRVLSEFQGEKLDCLVYGHSHHPVCRREGGILLFNPGSPTDRRWAPFHSVGILEIGETIHGRIIRLEE